MHELAFTLSILRILETEAESRGFSRVRTVWLEVGALSHAEPEALRFSFAAASAGTLAEGAELVILEPPGQAWCLDCANTVTLPRRGGACPGCGGFTLRVVGGEEFRVTELEVE
ncbi:MAG: hydrogenase maturation nickel metallochaperone HypA [Alphaproteobacteria bacterium]|nr:hydrogenase maturation nickel metallochaperone HypA [Alphaproteobacteria bacterium]MBF0129511.1 hydrogenase maturation nickel metallochaperone HypA [Alphaproteobacteria bacterium]